MRTAVIVVFLLSLLTWASPATAQTFINQQAVEQVLAIHSDDLESVPEVYYDYYDLYADNDNSVLARNDFYKALGMGDMEKGSRRARLVELLNRIDLAFVRPGDTLVVPDTFGIDFRAYAPFPRYYEGAKSYDKLFIIHKTVQAWAAYEHGELARWGVVSTGKPESPTPTGRFNFNWKEPYRVSELSPPDEDWEMYWVFNFNNERGIHIHQYDMPTDGPTSHGCVRLVDADARWIFDWADAWTVQGGGVGYNSASHKILKQGTTVLVLGEDPPGKADLFERNGEYPLIKQVELPANPASVPAGTNQQRAFDRLRKQSAKATAPAKSRKSHTAPDQADNRKGSAKSQG